MTIRLALTTILCCGLNLLAAWMKSHPRLARLAVLVVIANEIRGLALVWESKDLWLPLITH